MADLKPLAGMSQEETLQTMCYLLAELVDRSPIRDPSTDATRVAFVGTQPVSTAASTATVTTYGGMAQASTAVLYGFSVYDNINMAAYSLYNHIQVS